MRNHLVRIGNFQGIRLPKAKIEQAGLTEELGLEVIGARVLIGPSRHPRDTWTEAAAGCNQAGEDRLDDWDVTTGDTV